MNSKDALDKIEAGADLIQLYTGFIYEGPSIVKKINQFDFNNIEHGTCERSEDIPAPLSSTSPKTQIKFFILWFRDR